MAGSTMRRATVEKAIQKTLQIADGEERVHSGHPKDAQLARQRAQAMRFALECFCRELDISIDHRFLDETRGLEKVL